LPTWESSALQIPASHFPTPGQELERKFSTSKLTAAQNQFNQPLVQENVRFRFVKRGLAPTVNELAGRWNSDPLYGQKIINTIRLLYEHRTSVGWAVRTLISF